MPRYIRIETGDPWGFHKGFRPTVVIEVLHNCGLRVEVPEQHVHMIRVVGADCTAVPVHVLDLGDVSLTTT